MMQNDLRMVCSWLRIITLYLLKKNSSCNQLCSTKTHIKHHQSHQPNSTLLTVRKEHLAMDKNLTKWGPQTIAKLGNSSNFTMVYGRYNELVNGVYKPTCNWGASHCSNLSIRKCHLPTTNSSVPRPWWLMHQSHSTDFTGSTPLESMFASTLWQPITKHGNIIFRIHTWCCFFKVSIYSACSYDFPRFTHMFPMFVP